MGMELVTMFQGGGFAYLILKPFGNTEERWIMRANSTDFSQRNWRRMSNTVDGGGTVDFSQAKYWTAGGEYGQNIYYAIGGKVYAFNIIENQPSGGATVPGGVSYLVLDGCDVEEEVTYLGFARGGNDIYVGSYNNNTELGTLTRYVIRARPLPFIVAEFSENDRVHDDLIGQDYRFGPPNIPDRPTVTPTFFRRIVDIMYK